MRIEFAPNDILQINDARIIYRNFSGAPSKFNREGDRDFSVVIPEQEMADELMERGWNVKIKPPRDEDDAPLMYLKVKVKFTEFGPNVYLDTNGKRNKLNEETIGIIDDIYIIPDGVSLDIRPYDWEINGKTGRTAYLKNMKVIQDVNRGLDRFAAEYEEEI
jgi:hypothetical protein